MEVYEFVKEYLMCSAGDISAKKHYRNIIFNMLSPYIQTSIWLSRILEKHRNYWSDERIKFVDDCGYTDVIETLLAECDSLNGDDRATFSGIKWEHLDEMHLFVKMAKEKQVTKKYILEKTLEAVKIYIKIIYDIVLPEQFLSLDDTVLKFAERKKRVTNQPIHYSSAQGN